MKVFLATCALVASTATAMPSIHKAHQHHHAAKRHVDIVTETTSVMHTEIAYATAWVYPDGKPVTPSADVQHPAFTPPPATPSVPPVPAYTPSPRPVTSAVANSETAPTPVYTPPFVPETTHLAQASPPTHNPPVQSSAAQAPSAAQAASSVSSGSEYTGDMTYYGVGLGSCGWASTPNEAIVAIPHQQMDNPANPNSNPLCGKTVTISYGGKTKTAKIVDTCGGCSPGDLDMSTSLFSYFAPMSEGRVPGMKWSIN